MFTLPFNRKLKTNKIAFNKYQYAVPNCLYIKTIYEKNKETLKQQDLSFGN